MSRAQKAEFAAEKQEQCFRAVWAGSGVREEADETRAPPRSHRMTVAEGGAAGLCMALL